MKNLFIRNKRERKVHFKKTFLSQNTSYFFFFIAMKEEKSKQKRIKDALFLTTLRLLNKMDVAGEPALSRSLKNARGASSVH